jgi:nucleolar complex protein 2
MVFVLREMDGVFRVLLGMTKDSAVGNVNLEKRPRWKKLEPLIKSFLGNGLHVLGQMTDPEMITFTLRRLGASTVGCLPVARVRCMAQSVRARHTDQRPCP